MKTASSRPRRCPGTYAASRHYKPFNWFRFLNRKRYTDAALDHATDLSSQWVTCACGNQCAVLPRNAHGEPEDAQLLKLGRAFNDHLVNMWVAHKDYKVRLLERSRAAALSTLAKIEHRATVLLAKMGHAR